MNFQTLATRALNTAWGTHKPTYAALRFLLSSTRDDGKLLVDLVTRRLVNRRAWRYYGFQATKEAPVEGEPRYRNCIVGSPLTLLAEAIVLQQLSPEPAFSVPECGYSYQWPGSENHGRNFRFFMDGYHLRNAKAKHLLSQDSRAVAIVADIKDFYPSVDTTKLWHEVDRRLSAIQDKARENLVRMFIHGMLKLESPKTSVGLPIGPDLSHALAHIALANVDARMSNRFGPGYLRYVDDIIIVCQSSESPQAGTFLWKVLDDEGFKLNEKKSDEVSARTWVDHCWATGGDQLSARFTKLISLIVQFAIQHPDKVGDLDTAFRDNGFAIPFGRVRALAKSERFWNYLGWRTFLAWILQRMQGGGDSVKDLVELGRNVREEYLTELTRIQDEAIRSEPMWRRWQVQKWRLVVNRLMYLLAIDKYKELVTAIPTIDELV